MSCTQSFLRVCPCFAHPGRIAATIVLKHFDEKTIKEWARHAPSKQRVHVQHQKTCRAGCVCVYMSVHVHIQRQIYTSTHMHVYIHIHMCMYSRYKHRYLHTYVHVYICTCTHMYQNTYQYIYIHMKKIYIDTSVHIYVCSYTHTCRYTAFLQQCAALYAADVTISLDAFTGSRAWWAGRSVGLV